MDFYASTSTSNKLYENGILVDYKNFETNYDGEQLQAEYQDNNTIYYTKLNNDELSKLMMMSNNNSSLDIRLLNDFPITNKKERHGLQLEQKIILSYGCKFLMLGDKHLVK